MFSLHAGGGRAGDIRMQDQAVAAEQRNWRQSRLDLEAAVAEPVLRRQAHRMLWEI